MSRTHPSAVGHIGYLVFMTDEKNEAVQSVVDRVGGNQDGAPEGRVEDELRRGLSEAGVDLSDDEVARLVGAIDAAGGRVDAAEVLAR